MKFGFGDDVVIKGGFFHGLRGTIVDYEFKYDMVTLETGTQRDNKPTLYFHVKVKGDIKPSNGHIKVEKYHLKKIPKKIGVGI